MVYRTSVAIGCVPGPTAVGAVHGDGDSGSGHTRLDRPPPHLPRGCQEEPFLLYLWSLTGWSVVNSYFQWSARRRHWPKKTTT